jgi:hypothetical protein
LHFAITAAGHPAALAEATLPPPHRAGIASVRLANFKLELEPATPYTWSVSLAAPKGMPPSRLVARASVQRAAPDPAVASAVAAASPKERPAILAKAGLWYDALGAALESPDADHRAALHALLEDAGLGQVARLEQQHPAYSR